MWDDTLYSGSAAYYPHGRFPYPPELAAALRDELYRLIETEDAKY